MKTAKKTSNVLHLYMYEDVNTMGVYMMSSCICLSDHNTQVKMCTLKMKVRRDIIV